MIAGAGPAGLSTWIHLWRWNPGLARDAVLIERESLPRDKLCAGGITGRGDAVLSRLELKINVPSMLIQEAELRFARGSVHIIREEGLFRIVNRYEFDFALANAAREWGLNLREGECLIDYESMDDAVNVRTTTGRYRVGVLVGADGANSIVRSKLLSDRGRGVSRLIEVIQGSFSSAESHNASCAIFDFSHVRESLQGYVWGFPCEREGAICSNYGVFDSRVTRERRLASLTRIFDGALKARGVVGNKGLWKSHPIRWFCTPECFSAPRVLLVGDAAGVDPLLGEGISFALQYGELAAAEILQAFRLHDFSFSRYGKHLLGHPLGKGLLLRSSIARLLYSRWSPLLMDIAYSILALRHRSSPREMGTLLRSNGES
jgi:flavin-dependent dehydrogenase